MAELLGLVQIAPAYVVEVCSAYLAARKKHIDEERERYIVAAMKPYRKWTWRGPVVKTRTREEAIAHVKASHEFSFYSPWQLAALSGSRDAASIETLRCAAHLTLERGARDIMLVSVYMAELLKEYEDARAVEAATATPQ